MCANKAPLNCISYLGEIPFKMTCYFKPENVVLCNLYLKALLPKQAKLCFSQSTFYFLVFRHEGVDCLLNAKLNLQIVF